MPTRPIASCDARSTPASRGSTPTGSADVVIAYEPIWAIGTGRTASPEQAEDACGFIRSLVAAPRRERRDRGPDPLRRLDEARQRRRAARPRRRSTAASSAAPASTPTTSPRSSPQRARMSDPDALELPVGRCARHPRRLGTRRARSRQRRLAGRDADLRRALGALPAHDSSPPRAATSACPPGRWATPRSVTSTSAPAAVVKQDLARIDDAIADGTFFENEALLAACARGP